MATPNKTNELKVEFLNDRPLDDQDDKKIKFGYKELAQSIADIVVKAPTPFTIGLFGRWGTGKSTIINLTEKLLASQEVETVVFDVWKYEDDSFRRQFLIVLDEKLGLKLDYKNVLNQSLTRPTKYGFWRGIWEDLIKITRGAVVILLTIFVVLLASHFTNIPEWLAANGYVSTKAFEAFYNLSLISVFLAFALAAINIVKGTTQEHRTDSAEGFEDRFYKEVLPKIKKNKKLLIFIDNLDRASYKEATKVLSDIKTFLAQERNSGNVVFLVACDEKAVKGHLQTQGFENPTEFLRKFFNIEIRIPRFLNLELDRYTRDLLTDTKIGSFKTRSLVERLINYSFKDNPREIKQFINSLLGYYLLANTKKNTEKISANFINENLHFITWLLVFSQKFHKEYEAFENVILREGMFWGDKDLIERLEFLASENKGLEEFIKDTDWVMPTTESIGVFLTLRRSQEEKTLEGWDSFIQAATNGDKDIAEKVFRRMKS